MPRTSHRLAIVAGRGVRPAAKRVAEGGSVTETQGEGDVLHAALGVADMFESDPGFQLVGELPEQPIAKLRQLCISELVAKIRFSVEPRGVEGEPVPGLAVAIRTIEEGRCAAETFVADDLNCADVRETPARASSAAMPSSLSKSTMVAIFATE